MSKLVKLYDYYLDNGVHIIIVGDKKTNGQEYAQATIVFPKAA